MGHTQGGTTRGPTDAEAVEGSRGSRVVGYLRHRLGALASWLRGLGNASGAVVGANKPARSLPDDAPATGLRTGPVASLTGGRAETPVDAERPGIEAPALPGRPSLVVEETTESLRVSDPDNEHAYLESDRWVTVRP